MKDQSIAVITGATSGIGKATAYGLASQGYTLALIGKDEKRGSRIRGDLRDRYPNIGVEFEAIDLSSISEVKCLSSSLTQRYDQIDILINNAGRRYDSYRSNSEGIELTFATNHLGHFVLSNLLLPALVKSGKGRVITISSIAHHSADLNYPWIPSREIYNRHLSYANSKLANILFAFEHARRCESFDIKSNAVDPGIALTRFARNNGLVSWAKHILSHFTKNQLANARTSADTIIYLANHSEANDINGKLLYNRKIAQASPEAYDRKLAQNLWQLSSRITNVY